VEGSCEHHNNSPCSAKAGQFVGRVSGCHVLRQDLAVLWLRSLVAGLSPRRPGFAPGSIHVGFVVDKVALGQVFSEFFGFPLSVSFHRRSPNSYVRNA
jgi:hypothetical protein